MAKLDKMQFAKVLVYIAGIVQRQNMDSTDVGVLDDMIDIEVTNSLKLNELHELMRCMMSAKDDGYIPAIKAYRTLTGVGLKEAKDAVEKYR